MGFACYRSAQIVGGAADGQAGCRIAGFGARGVLSVTGLQFFQLQFKLSDLPAEPLRGPAELHALQFGDLQAQLLDHQRLDLHRGLRRLQLALAGQGEGAQRVWISRYFGRGERHGQIYQDRPPRTRIDQESVACQASIGCAGGGGATVRRQSIASTSSENCAGVSVSAPSTIGGQTKRPVSSRLAISHRPLPSQ